MQRLQVGAAERRFGGAAADEGAESRLGMATHRPSK